MAWRTPLSMLTGAVAGPRTLVLAATTTPVPGQFPLLPAGIAVCWLTDTDSLRVVFRRTWIKDEICSAPPTGEELLLAHCSLLFTHGSPYGCCASIVAAWQRIR